MKIFKNYNLYANQLFVLRNCPAEWNRKSVYQMSFTYDIWKFVLQALYHFYIAYLNTFFNTQNLLLIFVHESPLSDKIIQGP